jgi:hypothetical protein
MAGAGDFGMLIIAGVVVVGGIFLFQNPQILGQFAPQPTAMEAPPAAEEEPPTEEPEPDQQEPEVQIEYVDRPVPYPVPTEPYYPEPRLPRPLTRKQICSRHYGGSCAQECKQYGFGHRICRQCISYCGPPPPEYPRPRHRIPDYDYDRPRPRPRPEYPTPRPRPGPSPRPFPQPGKECPRGQRYNWAKKKCEVVPKPPKPTPEEPTPTPSPAPEDSAKTEPETPMSTSPDAGEPEETGQPANAANYASYYGWGY